MEDNKLYNGNVWCCPWCDYSNHIEDDLGVHMIANHDELMVNSLTPEEHEKKAKELIRGVVNSRGKSAEEIAAVTGASFESVRKGEEAALSLMEESDEP